MNVNQGTSEPQRKESSNTVVSNLDNEEKSLGSSQTIQQGAMSPLPQSVANEIKNIYSEKNRYQRKNWQIDSDTNWVDTSSNETEKDADQEFYFSRKRIVAVLMICFGSLVAIVFILIGLGKALRSGKNI